VQRPSEKRGGEREGERERRERKGAQRLEGADKREKGERNNRRRRKKKNYLDERNKWTKNVYWQKTKARERRK
jgi:hypothetical protein